MKFKSIKVVGAVCLIAGVLVSAVVVNAAAAPTPRAQVLQAKRAPHFLRHARPGNINRLSPRQRATVKRLVRMAAKHNPLSKGAQAADSWIYLGSDYTTLDDFYMVDQWYYNATYDYYEGLYQTCDSSACYWAHTYQIYYHGFTYGLYSY